MFVYVFHQLRQSSIISFLGGGGQHEYGSSLPSRLSEFIMIKHTSKTTTTEAGEEPAETKLQLQQQNLDFLFSFQDDNEIITSKDDKWDETDAENKQHILKSKQQQAMDDKDGSPVEMEINTRYWERLRKRKDAYISEKATRQQRIERDLNMTKGWRPSSTETDFSNYPVLESQILPDMTTQKGGIIIFLHVPKVRIHTPVWF